MQGDLASQRAFPAAVVTNATNPTPKLNFILSQFSSKSANWTQNLPSVKWSSVGHSALDQVLRGQLSASTTSSFHSYSCWQSRQKDWWIRRHEASVNCPSWDTLAIRWHSDSSHCCSPLLALCCNGNLSLHTFKSIQLLIPVMKSACLRTCCLPVQAQGLWGSEVLHKFGMSILAAFGNRKYR